MSLFAGPERILRRFSVFAEEPCKSTITTTEPCSPVFKEAQPRPSNSQSRRAKHSVEFKPLIVVHNVFLLLVICCCNKASNRIVPKTKGISVFWIPLSPEVSRLSPYTHAHINIRELQEPSVYLLYTGGYTPSVGHAPPLTLAACCPGWDDYQDLDETVAEMAQCLIEKDGQLKGVMPRGGTLPKKKDTTQIMALPPNDDTTFVPTSEFPGS